LTVTDTGTGIDPAAIEHIFEPFFTTKPAGTGLGLSIAQSIVSDLGGGITVDSSPGEGSSFRILLPVAGSAMSGRTVDSKDSESLLFRNEIR